MWSVGSEAATLYLGATSAGLWTPGSTPIWIEGDPQATAATLIDEALATVNPQPRAWLRPRARLRVVLSGALARPFVVDPTPGLANASEALALAKGMVPEAVGLTDPAAVWLSALPKSEAALAVTVPTSIVDALRDAATAAGFNLVSIRPWWARALDRARETAPALRALVVVEPDAATLLISDGDRWVAGIVYQPRPLDEHIEGVLRRRLFETGVGAADMYRMRLDLGASPESNWPAARVVPSFEAT